MNNNFHIPVYNTPYTTSFAWYHHDHDHDHLNLVPGFLSLSDKQAWVGNKNIPLLYQYWNPPQKIIKKDNTMSILSLT